MRADAYTRVLRVTIFEDDGSEDYDDEQQNDRQDVDVDSGLLWICVAGWV
jgi:hypothetical protein